MKKRLFVILLSGVWFSKTYGITPTTIENRLTDTTFEITIPEQDIKTIVTPKKSATLLPTCPTTIHVKPIEGPLAGAIPQSYKASCNISSLKLLITKDLKSFKLQSDPKQTNYKIN